MDDGNRRGRPSRDKDPILTGASSLSLSSVTRCRQREMNVRLGGWMDGWMDGWMRGRQTCGSLMEQGTTCPCVLSVHLLTSALFWPFFSIQPENQRCMKKAWLAGAICCLVVHFVVYSRDGDVGLSGLH